MCGYKSSERHKVREQKTEKKRKENIVLLLTIYIGLDDERK